MSKVILFCLVFSISIFSQEVKEENLGGISLIKKTYKIDWEKLVGRLEVESDEHMLEEQGKMSGAIIRTKINLKKSTKSIFGESLEENIKEKLYKEIPLGNNFICEVNTFITNKDNSISFRFELYSNGDSNIDSETDLFLSKSDVDNCTQLGFRHLRSILGDEISTYAVVLDSEVDKKESVDDSQRNADDIFEDALNQINRSSSTVINK
ncbi:MAG: hypothetical protein N4A33_09045 [Bacteriovoracaceae bacterium]|jgi:hypothetical protein|nr:hypothetical protein [Bacteriovoracaceae bacterium]